MLPAIMHQHCIIADRVICETDNSMNQFHYIWVFQQTLKVAITITFVRSGAIGRVPFARVTRENYVQICLLLTYRSQVSRTE
jgi:hypothetical protein